MAFTTKIDFSSNRQVKQYEQTFTTLSGGTVFGVPFSGLTAGPNLATSIVTEFQLSVISTFSGNSGSTIYTWGDSRMELGASALVPITPLNSGTTQETGEVYTGVSFVTIDGNTSVTQYTGVSFDVSDINLTDLGGGNYSGSVTSFEVDYLSTGSLDFTGRTIWIDTKGITRTEKLIVTNNPQLGATLTCIDSEGMAAWVPSSGSSTAGTVITGGTFDNATDTLTLENLSGGTVSITGFTDYYTTGTTLVDNMVYFNRNDALSAYTLSLPTGMTDTYITGSSFNNNNLTLINNTGGTITTLIDNFSGLTINGDLTVTGTTNLSNLSATTHTLYLTGNTVQGQLDDTENTFIDVYKINKTNFKDLYQTGLIRTDIDVSVLTSSGDTLTITNVDKVLFSNEILIDTNSNNVEDFVKSYGTVLFIADSVNTTLSANTRGVFYVGIDKTGLQMFKTAKIYDQDICYLARIIVENLAGVYSIISYKYLPDIAYNRPIEKGRSVSGTGYIKWSTSPSISFSNVGVTYEKDSINYSNDKTDPNYLVVPDSSGATPMSFLFILPNNTSLATPISASTVMDPKAWYLPDGTLGGVDVSSTNYQVYRLIVTVTGTLGIQTLESTTNAPQLGVNAIFGSREDALAGLTSIVFPELLPSGDFITLGTFLLRAGTNVNGSQMIDTTDFYFRPIGSSSSSSNVAVTTHDELSGKNSNPTYQHVLATDIVYWNQIVQQSISDGVTGSSPSQDVVYDALGLKANDADTVHKSGDTMTGGLTGTSFVTISGASTDFVKGDGSLDSTLYEDSANKQNSMNFDGTGVKYPTVDAVNLQANNLLIPTVNTGFIDRLDPFKMVLTDPNTITVTASNPGAIVRTRLFAPPFTPLDSIRNISARTYLASDISLGADGRYFRQLGYDYSTDSIIDSTTSFVTSDNIVALGFVEVLRSGGTNTFISFQMQVDISTVTLFDSVMVDNKSTSSIFPNNNLTVNNNNGGVLKAAGINWGQLNPHIRNIDALTPIPFTRINPSYLTTTSGFPSGTTVDVTTYWNGSSMVSIGNNNAASVQRWLMCLDGRIFLQAAEQTFGSFTSAESAVDTVEFTDIIPTELAIELCRMVAVKTATNLSSTSTVQFHYNSGGGGSAGGGAASFGTIGGSPYDNALLGAELNNKYSISGGTLYGDVLINTTTNNTIDNLQVNGSAISTAWKTNGGTANEYVRGDGSLGFITGGTTYVDILNINTVGAGPSVIDLGVDANGFVVNQASDIRLKKNINTIENALNKILKLRGVTYNWKDASRGGEDLKIGLIAQEVLEAVPELVTFNGDYLGVQYKEITALLIEAIKELTISKYTPTSSFDDRGIIGNISVDDDYLYIKTTKGWKRTNLESF